MHRLAAALFVMSLPALAQEAVPPVALRVAQDGVVGTTGTVYAIAPDGSWTASHFLNARTDPPHAAGTLSPAELAELARLLPRGREGTLAEGPPVNALRLELAVGDRAWTVETARDAETAPCTGAEPACAVTGVADWITGHLLR